MPGGKPTILVIWVMTWGRGPRPASFTIDHAMEQLNEFLASRGK